MPRKKTGGNRSEGGNARNRRDNPAADPQHMGRPMMMPDGSMGSRGWPGHMPPLHEGMPFPQQDMPPFAPYGSPAEPMMMGNPYDDHHAMMQGNPMGQVNFGGPEPPFSMPMHIRKPGSPMMDLPPGGPPGGGKLYAPNQNMVFNQANPNAPPIYPCGICRKEVHDSDQAVFCESGCNFWYHRLCTGLTEAAYAMLRSEVYAEWVCDRCLSSGNIPLIKLKP